jgi:hypothetical protein
MERSEFLIPLYFAPLWAPYPWIFLRLNSTADGRAMKKALALGISWGAMSFLLFGAVFLLIIPTVAYTSNDRDAAVVFGGLRLLQLSLMAVSIKAYLLMKPEPGDGRILWRLGVATSIILTCFLATPFFHLEKRASNEASAVSCLRTINTAQTVCAESHTDKGFAASLRDLGPPPGLGLSMTFWRAA